MSFNTIPYLAFLPLCMLAVFILPKKFKNVCLLLASFIFFISAGSPYYLLFLIFGTLVTYTCGYFIHKTSEKNRNFLIGSAIILQVVVLCFFKYNDILFPTLAQKLNELNLLYTSQSANGFSILAPLGISYYTFASISYMVDVAKGKIKYEKNLLTLSVFLSFFPQIVAGPIARADKLLPQLNAANYSFNCKNTTDALRIMLFGFFKKIAVADMLAKYINTVYSDVGSYTGLSFVFVAILYMVWLYCDFSGYSDIAFASAKMLGINICQNFETPLFSRSIREFWRRWHISLSSWLRDYIYIPLGGSRKGKPRYYLNLVITFLVSGIWHGSGLTFVIWGALHAFYQVVEALLNQFYKKSSPQTDNLVKKIFKTCFVYYIVAFSFVFFRSDSVSQAWHIVAGQFSDISLQTFFSQTISAIGSGFNSMPILIWGYIVFCIITVSIVTIFDALSYYKYGSLHPAYIIAKNKPWVRWVLYYILLGLIFAAFLMQNGNYVGNVSFAYANY